MPPALRIEASARRHAAEQSAIFAVAGMRICATVRSGVGRPVVLIHGNSASKAVWDAQIRLLISKNRPLLALDLPGHGRSDDALEPTRTYTFPGYADVVRAVCSLIGWREIDLVGWSLGGHIGLEMFPDDLVRSLLIVGTPPVRLSSDALSSAFFADATMRMAGQDSFSEADAVRYGTAMMGGTKYLTGGILRDIRRADGRARRIMLQSALAGIGRDQREVVGTETKPLCVVHGEEEAFVRLDYLLSLPYRALWGGRIQVIDHAGHAPHWQQPAQFNEILGKFLNHPMVVPIFMNHCAGLGRGE